MAQPVIRNAAGQINITFPAEKDNIKGTNKSYPNRTHDWPRTEHDTLHKVMSEMDRLVGLEHVKDFVYEIYAWLHITQCRREIGLKGTQQTLHMIFKGNPGTGKTTVARIVGQLFHEMGVLEKGHLIEVERADLVGEYIGHTAQKTKEAIKKSLGGILFIDEAYALARGGEKDFGKEAIDTLVKGMEDHHDEFVLILAGYPREMQFFLSSNPGLPSRFPVQLSFPDYTIDELLQIAHMMAQDRDYRLSEQSKTKIRELIYLEMNKTPHHFSNARFVRNLIEKAIREHAVRLLHYRHKSKQDLMNLSAQDFVQH